MEDLLWSLSSSSEYE